MTRARPLLVSTLLWAAALAAPAMAHPGSHEGLSLAALAEHLATPWHSLPLLAVAAAGAGLIIAGLSRRAARSGKTARKPGDEA